MNPKPGYFLLVVLAFLVFTVPNVRGQALDEWASVRGTVVDAEDVPIIDALVAITNNDMGREYSAKTKRKGQFSCSRIMPGKYSFMVSKDGYKCATGFFSVIPKGRQTLEIILVREPPGVVIQQKKAVDLFNEGVALAKNGEADEAIRKLEESIALNPAIAEAHYNLGVLYRETGRTDEAEIALLDALDLDPGVESAGVALAEIYFQQGNRLVDEGQFDIAYDVLCEAFSFDNDHTQTNYLLGMLCVRKGDDEGAVGYFEDYLRLAPDSEHSAEVRSALDKLLDGN